ncbi:MAG: LptF/LptG family permease [Synechococcales cyanobacterium]
MNAMLATLNKGSRPQVHLGWATAVMDRYVIMEMVLPFLFGVAAFTSLAMAIGSLFELVRLVAESGLSISRALHIFVLRTPSMVVLTFPMSMLLATLLAYSRLSGDSETVAMRGAGVSVYRLVAPAVVLSLAVTVVTFAFNEVIVPTTNRQAAQVFNQALQRDTPQFERENILYQEFGSISSRLPDGTVQTRQGLTRQFYARRFDGREMQGIVVLDFSTDGLNQILLAQSGEWQPEQKMWLFTQGTTYVVSPDGTYSNILTFTRQALPISRDPLDLAQESRRPEEMNIQELSNFIRIVRNSGDMQQVRRLEVQLHLKYAIPFVCLTFALVGSPLGMRPTRTSSSIGLGISVLIIFAYYVFSFITQALGQTGTLGPMVAAWLPNLVGMGIGGFLIVRAAQ